MNWFSADELPSRNVSFEEFREFLEGKKSEGFHHIPQHEAQSEGSREALVEACHGAEGRRQMEEEHRH
ncbi:hypothetical protein CAEBREN_17585 [Caenorhabditis brenneri]|uniref:Uncharacterized protein n=1 Tax=Caenorhabditis brenneri TaxID=135651 RepID=G0PDR2_CAEBE|nr:hypothetical protein CAEBREN_17585 [Caenorhabditis brenneri]